MKFPDRDDSRRIRIYMTPPMSEALASITDRGVNTTKAVRDAINLYAFVLRNRDGGRKLVSVRQDGTDPVDVM